MGDEKRPLKTLERVLSKAGLGSRTEARSWIHARRVEVNGKVIENPDYWVDLERDKVRFDGKPLVRANRRYLLLNKPAGYLTTYSDPDGRPTVYALLPDLGTFLGPVGRLDMDTSGLLLFTNDTQLAERLTNPDYHVPKTYVAACDPPLSDDAVQRLRSGIVLDDGPTRPAQARRLDEATIELTIREGRNRQVRRMVEAVGSRVVTLTRERLGPLSLVGLAEGAWRELNPGEVHMLKQETHGGTGARRAEHPQLRKEPGRAGKRGEGTGKR